MKEIKKSASIKSKVKGKETPFNVDLNYSEEYDSFNIKVKKGEGFMSYTDSLQGLPLEVVQKLNEMLEEVLIKAGSKTEMKEHKMFDGGNFQSGVYANGGGVQGKLDQNKNIFQKQDLVRERYELLNDMYNNEDSNVDYNDILKVGDVLYGDDINGYERIFKEVNDPVKGDYFIFQDRFNNKFAFYITQAVRDLYAKELYIQNVNIPQKDFLYSDEVIDINNKLEFHKGRINLYKKNPNDASNYSGINYSDYMSSLSNVKDLEEKLKYALKEEGHKFAKGGGVGLIGNQKSIDLNKNGKIDAEDFKLLRTTMNGAWRNEHKHVNSTSRKDGKVIDYEVNYARKFNPSRKGYKGKTFANGGGVDRFSEYSNDALYDMIINLSRYENTESEIQMVKAELEKRKANKKMTTGGGIGIEEEIDLTDDKKLRLRKPVMPERKYSKIEWAEKFNPRAYEYMGKTKMATGGSLPSGSINALGDLWFAVQQKDTDDYKMLSENLDKLNVPFAIQNEVSADAESQRGRKALNIPEVHDRIKKIVEKNSRKFATGGGVEKISFEDWLKKNNIEVYKRTYYWVADDGGNDYMYSGSKGEVMKSLREDWKKSFAYGGGVSKFKMLSDKVARNYEGKRVKPQYQKEYGKVYSKSEAKEVGDKVAGKVKAMQKMNTGGATKKGGKGGIMVLAKQIRKEGESWQDAVKRAGQQLK
jgi:hypothetical protein